MRTVEAEGPSIDSAIARALEVLGAPREQVHVEIIEAECGGVLGFGRRKARVTATIREAIRVWLEDARPPRVPAASRPSTPRPAPAPAPGAMLSGAEIVRQTLRLMDLGATVSEGGPLVIPGEPSEGEARVLTLEGKEIDALVGRRGDTLEALEYLVNRMLDHGGRSDHVTLEAAGYHAKRRAGLEDMVRRACARAHKTRRAVTLEQPLAPGDRKLVHELLKSERGLAVRSAGRGLYRKVTLIPGEGRRGGGKTTG